MPVGAPPQAHGLENPFGVPPSPSRLLALMPPRPSATGIVCPSTVSQPLLGRPAAARTWIAASGPSREFVT